MSPEPPGAGTARADGTNCCQSCITAQMAKPGCESWHLSSEVTLMGNGQSGGCVSVLGVFVLANLCCGDSVVCVTEEQDNVGIVPSAFSLLLPISVTRLVLTTKYHSLILAVIECICAAMI